MGVPVAGYESFYSIDEYGNVYSIRSKRNLKHSISASGYHTVEFNVNGKVKRVLVHRLVATAFLENPLNLPQVNHKDENKSNNCVTNLEWCTAKYNMAYGTGPKRRHDALSWFYATERLKQISRNNGKVVSKPVLQIDKVSGKILAIFESARKAATLLKLNHSHICECCLGKRYKTVGGFRWKYQERM